MNMLGLRPLHWVSLAGLLLFLGLAAIFWPSSPPPEQPRSDMLLMRNGDWLQGRLRADALSIDTEYGRIEFPIELIRSIAATADPDTPDVLLTVGGDRFSGRLTMSELAFDPAAGSPLSLPVDQITELKLDSGFQQSPTLPDWRVTMRNGDRFHVAPDTRMLSLATSFGQVEVLYENMLRLVVEVPDDGVVVSLRDDQGELRGKLPESALSVRTVTGQVLNPELSRIASLAPADSADAPMAIVEERGSGEDGGHDPEPFHDTLADGSPGPTMVLIPAGSFVMGPPINPSGYSADGPARTVSIESAFAIGVHEITFTQYDRFAEVTGRSLPRDQDWGRDDRPVIHVSWQDAMAYADWLSEQTGARYRLPTEVEWEYAARAGSRGVYWWGDAIGQDMANCEGCNDPPLEGTTPVGSYPANAFGLHDVLGNVWEWTCSLFDEHLQAQVQNCAARDDLSLRTIRGGSWFNTPRQLGLTVRDVFAAQDSGELVGFRLVREL